MLTPKASLLNGMMAAAVGGLLGALASSMPAGARTCDNLGWRDERYVFQIEATRRDGVDDRSLVYEWPGELAGVLPPAASEGAEQWELTGTRDAFTLVLRQE